MPTPNASKCRFHATSQFLFQYLTISYATFRKKSWDHENLHFFKNLQCFLPLGGKVPVSISEAILKDPCRRPSPGVPTKLRSFFCARFWYGSFNNFRPRETYTRHEQQTSFWYIYSMYKRPVSSENSLPSPLVTLRDHHHSILRFPGPPKHMPTAAATKNLKTGWRRPRVFFHLFRLIGKIWLNTTFEKYIYIYITYCKSIKTHM